MGPRRYLALTVAATATGVHVSTAHRGADGAQMLALQASHGLANDSLRAQELYHQRLVHAETMAVGCDLEVDARRDATARDGPEVHHLDKTGNFIDIFVAQGRLKTVLKADYLIF